MVTPLVGQRGLTLGEIERRLLLAGDTPGVALISTLKPGETTGATILVVEARQRPVSGFVGADNTLASALGRSVLNTGLDLNSVFGLGETVYLRAYGHPGGDDFHGFGGLFTDRPRVRTLAAGAVVPIGVDGLTFNVEGTQSKTTPKPLSFQTASDFERLSLRLRYPWIRSRQLNVGSELDLRRADRGLLAAVARRRHPALAPTACASRASPPTCPTSCRRTASSRRGRSPPSGSTALGARSAADANVFNPLSRLGADADFQKLEGLATLAQPIADHLAFAAYCGARPRSTRCSPARSRSASPPSTSSRPSTPARSAATAAGSCGARSPRPGRIAGLAVPVTVAPYAYAATGALYLQRPTVLEQGTTHVSSLAVGLRFGATIDPGFSDASLALEFGRAFRDDDEPDANRFTVVGSVRF